MTANFFESFLNINIGSGTNDYFSQHDPSANSISFETLSVQENVLTDNELKIYPNPTTDVISIRIKADVKNITFYNILGKRVLETTETYNIPTSQLAKGVYLIKIQTGKGEVTKKIVKE